MTREIVLRHHSLNRRRQPLLASQQSARKENLRLGEVAGGTAAERAAVCCCCPCGLVNLFVLAVYKLPAGLCRKALHKEKKPLSFKSGLLTQRRRCMCDFQEKEVHIPPVSTESKLSTASKIPDNDDPSVKKVLELEKEMWDSFYGTGFWRSPSQRQ
ncbi:uncharacterized protein LOC122070771 [Macadamia integrifolia]|uniref:uncharacterized protein LOC122070771 n=1 Tax=Macadamia integrifolia TaxID=60698 RepID=UPI001C4E65F8|nr:uncharacterized protein LOC122070771 [Macadamia integrifolia]